MHKEFKNKKGFTLVELLAVIVILAILMLFAGSNVITVMNNARKSSFRSEFLSLLDTAQLRAQQDMMYGTALQTNGKSICYCFGDGCSSNQLTEFDNKGGYSGSVLVTNEGDGNLTFKGWMYSDSYQLVNKDTSVSAEDVGDFAGTTSQNCGG